jgi:hypothetical protein
MGSRKPKTPLTMPNQVPSPWEEAPWEGDTSQAPMPTPNLTGILSSGKVTQAKVGKPKVTRKVEWRSPNGKVVVVAGPFPRGFYRSDTRDSVEKASKIRSADLWAHEPTERDDRYAKCMVEDVVEIIGGENEFGTVIP